jgi:hypothetical protein
MAIISDDLVTDLRSLRGTELERTVHDAIKVGIDDALTKNIAPVMVGYEAMAQGLAILTGADLDQSRDALLNVIKDLGAQLSAIQTVTPPAHDCRFRTPHRIGPFEPSETRLFILAIWLSHIGRDCCRAKCRRYQPRRSKGLLWRTSAFAR